MNEKVKFRIDSTNDLGIVTIIKTTYIEYRNKEIILDNHMKSYSPLDKETAKNDLPENLYNALVALWIPSVIDKFKDSLNEQ